MTDGPTIRRWFFDAAVVGGKGEYQIVDVKVEGLHLELCVSPTGRSKRVFVNGHEIKWKDLSDD